MPRVMPDHRDIIEGGGGRGDCISRESENSRGDEILARPTGLQLNTVGNIRIVAIIKRQTNLGVSEGPP